LRFGKANGRASKANARSAQPSGGNSRKQAGLTPRAGAAQPAERLFAKANNAVAGWRDEGQGVRKSPVPKGF